MRKRKINICIVEDESILLRNMKKKIQAVSENVEIIAEAFDGQEALEKITENCPDIVFTDIRMPVMDGLELARVLHRDFPDIFIVIVSGYDDFEYARTALKYGVCEYLLKPLRPDELKNCLTLLQDKILSHRAEEEQQFLESWVNGTDLPENGINNAEEWGQGRFSLFLVSVGNLQINGKGDRKNTACLLEEIFRNIREEGLPFEFSGTWDFPGKRGNLRLLLLENPAVTPRNAAQSLLTFLHSRYPQIVFNLAFTEKLLSFKELYQVAIDVYRILEMALVIGRSAVLSEENLPSDLPTAVLSVPEMQQLQTLIISGNAEGFRKMLKQMFRTWDRKNCPQQWINRMLVQILDVLQRTQSLSEENYERINYEIFAVLEDSPSLEKAGDAITEELVHRVFSDSMVPSEVECIIEEMDVYIHKHYTETINLAELAEKYHFNQSYLTRVFKKQKGIAPLKLINTLRMDKAQELLLSSDLSVREISEMLGFSNQHYFSRIFKEFTDLTPMEYRMVSEKNGIDQKL